MDTPPTAAGVGARVRRKEDERLLRGRGRFVGDIAMPGMLELAFVRSPVAHARIRGFEIPEEHRDAVFTWADMAAAGIRPIRAVSGLPGFKVSEQPALADGKVRFVGEPVAVCVAATRAEAEDIAAQIFVDVDELPVNTDMLEAVKPGAPKVHEHWADNVFLETNVGGSIADVAATAPIKVSRSIRTARQCMVPMEGKGVLAHWDRQAEQIVLTASTQLPHIVRAGLAECLGIEQGLVRVIAPDVGGGFGWKGLLQPEEVVAAWLAMKLDRPIRWTEDRREHLVAAANCREHHYEITAYADERGKLLGLEADAWVDAGSYSVYPFSACLEAAQVGSILPGPYDFQNYRCRTFSVATNKPPIVPYRGVARTGVCFAMEQMIDAVAEAVGREPWEVRAENLVPPEKMPFDNITKKHFDSGDYPESVRQAVAAIGLEGWRARQTQGEPDGRMIGVGFATYCEQAAHGTAVYHGWGIPMVPGHEQAQARVTPDGGLELRVGVQSHGQGMETTFAQVAHEVLGIPIAKIKLVHGDTGLTPYSTGTWGSRSMVMAGGAVATASRQIAERLRKIGAHLLQARVEDTVLRGGAVHAGAASVSIKEIAHTWYRAPQLLPADVDRGGLELTAGYKPKSDHGTFSYATHAVAVAVDPDLGTVEILDYVVVEDAGTMVNPMVVDGQICGGVAQGIGTALYERVPYDETGQPLSSTFADYLIPGFTEVPHVRIIHMVTPSPYTEFGVKGIGEGGAIAPPAALCNAINDALRPLGARVTSSPMTPDAILSAIAEAGR
ncbi:xanthine dehydrogenase family protein [Azospirillum sp. RWY-5-1]|uniref:Xanthine dehydrogenase family protein n=1 Tax=Azospirillum oleiclasticum TaxID=2735135 RepID=A0ABX2T7M4_9PROT|nr:xanthine dehydrogenase family protein molybdopterin-binding subunit [Azospirillum oleiclasticum]NYZ12635.1 xanthine dehydrogenase family protein [Azospirillum oleiclasticum]NYZ19795.1 xanthine dehydrogenase family protein [Azospirillum oleiclasticum]